MSDITDIDNDLPSLELDVEDLKGQLKGVINADMSSEASTKLVPYISEREGLDALVTLDGTKNRSQWASNAINIVEVEVPDSKGCCVLS